MTLELLFWILMLLVLVLGGWTYRARWQAALPGGILWVLLLILGWAQFGPPIK